MSELFIKKKSNYSVSETSIRLTELLQAKEIHLFACIDHHKAAKENGLLLPEEQVIVFGDPKVGTYLMQECPQIGIELPLKVLVWQEGLETWVGYVDPLTWLENYKIEKNKDIIQKMATLMSTLTDRIVNKV